MAGRKAPKSGKSKRALAKDLVKKTAKKLKKLRPANQVDFDRLTASKRLHFEGHSTRNARGTHQDIVTQKSIHFVVGNKSWPSLLNLLKDGLPLKRAEALTGISHLLAETPASVAILGPQLLQALTLRLMDEDDTVRQYSVDVVGVLLRALEEHGSVGAVEKFGQTINSVLWLQLRTILSHIQAHKRLDGIRYLHVWLRSAAPSLFQDRTFIARILPLILSQLPLGLRPGLGKTKAKGNSQETVARVLTIWDDSLQPCTSRWGPMVTLNLIYILWMLTRSVAACGALSSDRSSLIKQLSLAEALDRALRTRDLGAEESFHTREKAHCFAILEFATGLIRLSLTQAEEPALRHAAGAKLANVAFLTVCILRWLIALLILKDNGESERLDVISSPLAQTPMSLNLAQMLFQKSQGKGYVSAVEFLEHGRRGSVFLQCVADLIKAASMREGEWVAGRVKVEVEATVVQLLLCDFGVLTPHQTVLRQRASGIVTSLASARQAKEGGESSADQLESVRLELLPSPDHLTAEVLKACFDGRALLQGMSGGFGDTNAMNTARWLSAAALHM